MSDEKEPMKVTPDQQAILDRLLAAAKVVEAFAERQGWITPQTGGVILSIITAGLMIGGALWFRSAPDPAPTTVDLTAILKKLDANQKELLAAIAARPAPVPVPTPDPVPDGPVSLPAEVKASTGRMFKLSVKASTDFIWIVSTEAYAAADIHTAGSDLLITPLADGTFSIGAVAVAKGATPVWCRIVAGQGPQPPPPGPGGLLKHLTFIGAESTPASLGVNNDTTLRTMLKNAGVMVHVLRKDDPAIAFKGMTVALAKAGGAPAVILQDDTGHVLDQGPMASVVSVTELASKYIRR